MGLTRCYFTFIMIDSASDDYTNSLIIIIIQVRAVRLRSFLVSTTVIECKKSL